MGPGMMPMQGFMGNPYADLFDELMRNIGTFRGRFGGGPPAAQPQVQPPRQPSPMSYNYGFTGMSGNPETRVAPAQGMVTESYFGGY